MTTATVTTQITVRVPSDLVGFADAQVKAGEASSRAEVVSRALKRERRRLADEHDALVYATLGDDPELDGLAEWAARQPIDLD